MLGHRFFEGGKLPESYEAAGHLAVFKTDFRAWLKYEYLKECRDISGEEMLAAVQELCFESVSPGAAPDFLLDALAWFHSCAEAERLEKIRIPKVTPKGMEPKISLYWDFFELWASFRQQYQLDLY